MVTNDFNLNKIAQLQGVEVINLNELANALKSVALPGEMMTVRLVKPGDQIGQGVGYLEDGTMVVVEQGRSAIGQEVTITVTSVLQTPAGPHDFRPHRDPAAGKFGRPAHLIGATAAARPVGDRGRKRPMPRRFALAALCLPLGVAALLYAQRCPTRRRTKDQEPAGRGGCRRLGHRERSSAVLAARREYQLSLEKLRAYYISTGDIERARWAEDELLQYHRVSKQAFRLELDVPPPTLQGRVQHPRSQRAVHSRP